VKILNSLFSYSSARTTKKESVTMLFSTNPISRTNVVVIAAFSLILSACGGGGGSSAPAAPVTPPPTQVSTPKPPTTPVAAMGCGTVTSTGTGNSTQVVVDGFPCAVAGGAGAVNAPQVPYVSVKICAPGSTTNCQIIDHIILDTGSTGLRIAASALSSALKVGAGLTVASNAASTTLTECETYVDSFVYGPVVTADVYIAGKSALGTTMQIFGDTDFAVPSACSSNAGTETDTVQTFGGNGLLGVNFNTFDYSKYFNCNNGSLSTCTEVTYNTFQGWLPSIVTQFAADNNGVVITMPKVGASGSLTAVVGALYFGVGTQANNTPSSTTPVLALQNDGANDPTFGTFAVQVAGTGTWTSAYIDSGTDTVYFDDPADTALIACPSKEYYSGFYCPTSPQNIGFSYANFGTTTSLATVSMSVTSPLLFNANIVAFDNAAGSTGTSTTLNSEVALGLSTFFGHTNYFLFSGKTAPGTGFGGTASTTVTGPMNGIQ
jgi:hypothetical protein